MADTWLLLGLPSFRSLPIFAMTILSFSPNCSLHSWASQDCARPFTLPLLLNPPKPSCMMCPIHGMWFFNAGHLMPEGSRVDCSSWVIEQFEEALPEVIPSKRPSVGWQRSRTTLKCTACLAPVCYPLTYHPKFGFGVGPELEIKLIDSELYFSQCPIMLHIICNDGDDGKFVSWGPPVQSQTYFVLWWQLLHNCIHCQWVFPAANGTKGGGGRQE